MEKRCGWAGPEQIYIDYHDTEWGVPEYDSLSLQISKDLKKAGFKFCGPTIVYAWMEACGLINNHPTNCPRHIPCRNMARLPAG